MMLFKWIHITFKEAKVPILSNNFNIDTFQKLQRFNEKNIYFKLSSLVKHLTMKLVLNLRSESVKAIISNDS